jgi:hypothetical protein
VFVTNGKIYWADNVFGFIQRANLDGSGKQILLRGLPGPLGIDLDVAAGKIYWADASGIRRANLDGSGVQTLIAGLPDPSGIVLDVADGKMYWTDFMGVTSEGPISMAPLRKSSWQGSQSRP